MIKDYLQDNTTVHLTGRAYGCFNVKVFSELQSEQLIYIYHTCTQTVHQIESVLNILTLNIGHNFVIYCYVLIIYMCITND
jgi:hypothetical protein